MAFSLSACYERVQSTDRDSYLPTDMTREQLRQAVSTYDPLAVKETCLLYQLIEQEMADACQEIRTLGLPLESDSVKLLILSSFHPGAGFDTDELDRMSPATIKQQLVTQDVMFSRFMQQLFLHQTQPDILCQRFMTVLTGATVKKSRTRAERLQTAWSILH